MHNYNKHTLLQLQVIYFSTLCPVNLSSSIVMKILNLKPWQLTDLSSSLSLTDR